MKTAVPFALWMLPLLIAVGCRSDERDTRVPPRTGVDYFLLRAGEALQQEDPAEALRFARAALRTDTTSADAAFVVGEAMLRLGRLDAASRAFHSVLQRNAAYPDAWLKIGNIAYRHAAYEPAAHAFRQEVVAHPSASAWYNLGLTYQALGQADSAAHAFRTALQINAAYAPALHGLSDVAEMQGDDEAALAYAESASLTDTTNVEYRKRVALLHLRQGNAETAGDALRWVVSRAPMDAEAQYALGQAYRRLGAADEAERSFSRHRRAKELDDAVRNLEAQLRRTPDDPETLKKLARVQVTSRRHDEAAGTYVRLLHLRPDDHDARVELATLLAAREKLEAAENHYRRVLEAEPGRARVWMYLGVLLTRGGRTQEGAEALARAASLDPSLRPRVDSLRHVG